MPTSLSRFVFGLWVGVSAALLLWRAAFGFDGFDEAFYLVHGFKLVPQGDALFTQEILSGLRQHDLFNYGVSWLLPESVLGLRWAAVLLYGACLLFLFYAAGVPAGFLSGLLFFVVFTFDRFLMPTWSYNWWLRNFLLVHHAVWFLRYGKTGASARNGALLAGVLAGCAIFSYNPVVLAFIAALVVWFWVEKRKSHWWLPYVAALLTVLTVNLTWITFTRPEAFLTALRTVVGERTTDGGKLGYVLVSFFGMKEYWFFLTAFFLLPMVFEVKSKWARAAGPVLALAVLYYLSRKVSLIENEEVLIRNGYVPMFLALATGFGWMAWRERKVGGVVLSVLTVAAAGCVSLSSVNGPLAAAFLVPLLLVPNLGRILLIPARKAVWLRALTAGSLAVFALGSLYHTLYRSFHDRSPSQVEAKFDVAPLQGIWTSRRRAQVYGELAAAVRGAKYILAYDLIPVTFLLGEARSAVPTVQVDSIPVPLARSLATLETILASGRIPDLIVKAQTHPWSWGELPEPLRYGAENPFEAFRICAAGRPRLWRTEFAVFEVQRERVAPCIAQVIESHRTTGRLARLGIE